ncbi:Fibrous sheath-interacting protein [Heracleum sosnowskyi]|uniref:Fibrous sheath-interacting protein n=1 Tax=Heracleum sosnowskyi TaxID=360622 RepID=A0AAD8IAR0_9APIA|nr:Fibrous sheath-interacting protein [Heracleum sosnowskyi]
MACGTGFRPIFLTEPWPSLPFISTSNLSTRCFGCRFIKTTNFYDFPRKTHNLKCTHTPNPSSDDEFDPELDQGPPQEAVLKAISELSKTEGRIGQTTNVVIGGTVTDDATNEWLTLDQKVNIYPTVRGFTAIGTGGNDFVQAMVVAVETVLKQPIPEGQVKQKMSSGGKYISVNIGPVHVDSSEQVQAVYNAMRRDERMKYFL